MTLRIGGVAAIAFGLLWTTGLAWASYDQRDEDTVPIVMTPIGYVCLIVAIAGLSASRRADTSGSCGLRWSSRRSAASSRSSGHSGCSPTAISPGSAGGHPGAVRGRRPRDRVRLDPLRLRYVDHEGLGPEGAVLIGSGAALSLVGGGGLASQPIFVIGLVAFAAGWVWLGSTRSAGTGRRSPRRPDRSLDRGRFARVPADRGVAPGRTIPDS